MKNYSVTVKAHNEFWLYDSYDTKAEAEEVRSILEAKMLGAKIEVRPVPDKNPRKVKN